MESKHPLTRDLITGDIRKIHLYYWPGDGQLCGMRFYDGTGKMIYESAYKNAFSGYSQHEILLNEGERIIGFTSRKFSDQYAYHYDF